MLKIKEEHKGKRIVNGRREIILDESLTQKQLLSIKNTISEDYVEEVKTFTPKSRGKKTTKKTNDKDNQESK